MLSTGIYLRVSTEEQVREGYSIRAQEEKLKSFATLKDWHIFNIYADEGISGKDIESRPEMKRLITDIESGKVKNVLVFKIDRLTRSTKNLIELMELFERYSCAFNSLSESITTDNAAGRMFLKLVGLFAEFERENLVERLRLGFERKAREGYTLAGCRHSYGYDRENGNKIQEINEEEAEIVKRIFDMYLNGDSNFTRIAKTLNAQKVPTKMGKRWAAITVKDVLQNPTYIGKIRYSCRDENRYFEVDGHHAPILDETTFFAAQDRIKKIQRIAYTKRPTVSVYFCGVLYCTVCGCKLASKWNYRERHSTGKTRKLAYPTYRCNNAIKNGGCTSRSMSHAKLEQAFLAHIERVGEVSADKLDEHSDTTKPNHSAELTTITSEIALIDKRTKEAMGLYMSGSLDFDEYQNMTTVGNERRKELETRLEQLQRVLQTRTVFFNKSEIAANVRANWQVMDDTERQQFIQKFVYKIMAHSEPPQVGRFNDVIIEDVLFNEY